MQILNLIAPLVCAFLAGCASYHAPTEKQVDANLRALHASEPDLHKRIVALARQNLNQPYELYLLGEAPFETIDDQPVYCLGKSDCVVFAEHTLAMSLTDDFPSFLTMLQRIRYKDGQIGVLTRNHYTEADWNINNRWLVRDLTIELDPSAIHFVQTIDRSRFFRQRYKVDTKIPVQTWDDVYIPYERMDAIKPLLRDGDVVNFVTGTSASSAWVGHVGLIAHGTDGSVHLIHSSAPRVREETIESYIQRATRDVAAKDKAGKARFRGFKFLRVNDDALARLKQVDGASAPRVSVPKDSSITFADYLASFKL